jgi:hypothetical protein
MSLEGFPMRIHGIGRLRESLAASQQLGERLNEEQVQRFIALTFGG